MKPGYLTTEFYLTLLTNLAGIGALFGVNVGDDLIKALAVVAAAIATAVYAYSRAKVKATP